MHIGWKSNLSEDNEKSISEMRRVKASVNVCEQKTLILADSDKERMTLKLLLSFSG